MPSDYITIKALSSELNDTLKTGKINKITMPEKDEINLFIRAFNKNYILAISCNSSNPRIHLTNIKKQSPITAPAFCMHLRKYFISGYIEEIKTLNEDRIICISVKSHNELRDEVTYRIVVEMMGRYSNIVVLNSKDIITDALKQVSFDMMTKRQLLPSCKYTYVEQTKLPLSKLDEIKEKLISYNQDSLSKFLSSILSGLSKESVEEILYRAGLNDNLTSLTSAQIDNLLNVLDAFNNIYNTSSYKPCVSYKNGTPQDFFVTDYKKINEIKFFSTLNEAIEDTLAKKDASFRQEERTKFLVKAHKSFFNKCIKRLEKSKQRFADAQIRDTYKLYGELIISNIYRINKGDKIANCQNYYSENLDMISIPLDENLSPQQNAANYYKRYNKLKHQEEVAFEQIEELELLIKYLQSIEDYIKRATSEQDIQDLQKELENIGALKINKSKSNKKEKESSPLHYFINGYDVYVGKNNLQNDRITFKIAEGKDVWLHAKAFHGSHTIIISNGEEIPNEILQTACEICAFYSSASSSPKVEIDYTIRKNVKRHPSKKPGMVLYDVYKSALVEPNAHKEFLKN